MKKKLLPVFALGIGVLSSYAGTYMVVTKTDGTVVEYNVDDVDSVSYRKCKCECDLPSIKDWYFENGSKGSGNTLLAGSVVVFKGSNLSRIKSIMFGDEEAEISFALSSDKQMVLKVPSGISKVSQARFIIDDCTEELKSEFSATNVLPPCVTMCDNEFAVKTLKVVGNNFVAPLSAKFWDGKDYTIEASTEDGSIKIDDVNHATITIPAGVKDGGNILFENAAGEVLSDFIFRDTRNLLITHDDEYLNLFNQERPDNYRIDEESGDTTGLPIPKDVLKHTIFNSENTNGDFSIFHDLAGYTAWTYSPNGESNPTGESPKYPTPFGCFSESINNGETTFNDYVIRFEVFVTEEYPIQGNGLAISFYDSEWFDIRGYCAFWQPSQAYFPKDEEGVWNPYRASFVTWTSGGDWMTITIPMDELRFDFIRYNYFLFPQDDRKIVDGSAEVYAGFGDKENGLPFFDLYGDDFVGNMMTKKTKPIASIGIEFGNADQPNTGNAPLIAVDNLRIVPKDNNGGVYPFLKWGRPTRDFYLAPVMSCK